MVGHAPRPLAKVAAAKNGSYLLFFFLLGRLLRCQGKEGKAGEGVRGRQRLRRHPTKPAGLLAGGCKRATDARLCLGRSRNGHERDSESSRSRKKAEAFVITPIVRRRMERHGQKDAHTPTVQWQPSDPSPW